MIGKLLRSLSGRGQGTSKAVPSTSSAPAGPRKAGPEKAEQQTPSMPGLPFMIRPLDEADLPALSGIFQRAIMELTGRDYSDEQRAAWAAGADDGDFTDALRRGVTIVADNDGTPVAFAQLHPADYLSMLYVDPQWSGLGIPMLLCQYLEDEARILGCKSLSTHASRTAQRFFRSMGFEDQADEQVERAGVQITRHHMVKILVR